MKLIWSVPTDQFGIPMYTIWSGITGTPPTVSVTGRFGSGVVQQAGTFPVASDGVTCPVPVTKTSTAEPAAADSYGTTCPFCASTKIPGPAA